MIKIYFNSTSSKVQSLYYYTISAVNKTTLYSHFDYICVCLCFDLHLFYSVFLFPHFKYGEVALLVNIVFKSFHNIGLLH